MPRTKIQINLSPNTYKLTWSSDTICSCPLLALTAMSNLRPPCHKVSRSAGAQPTVYAKRPITNGPIEPRFVMFALSSYVVLKIICAIWLLRIATWRGNVQKHSHLSQLWHQESIIPLMKISGLRPTQAYTYHICLMVRVQLRACTSLFLKDGITQIVKKSSCLQHSKVTIFMHLRKPWFIVRWTSSPRLPRHPYSGGAFL